MLAAKIALNTNHYAGIGDVNNKRTFELGGMGAFQLTDNRPALNEYFEVGKEVVTFDGRADLKEKVQYYLARPDERQRIAQAAAERAHRDHTFEKRLEVLLPDRRVRTLLRPAPLRSLVFAIHPETCRRMSMRSKLFANLLLGVLPLLGLGTGCGKYRQRNRLP